MEKSHFANVVPTLISTPVQMNSNTQLGSIHVLKQRKKIKLNIHSFSRLYPVENQFLYVFSFSFRRGRLKKMCRVVSTTAVQKSVDLSSLAMMLP